MPRYYSDNTGSALSECRAVRATDKMLCAALLGYSGTQKEGEDARDYLYHHDITHGASLYCKLATALWRVDGFIFFRHCPQAPSDWLIVSMGTGRPSEALCLEALRRFNRSFNL